MKHYDHIVVGSGISGLSLALLLGMNQRSVLLLEKNPKIGGALARFFRKALPFDTGFHFTGGFSKNGVLTDMLRIMGMEDEIHPIFLTEKESNQFLFEKDNTLFQMPTGYENVIDQIKFYFPKESATIDTVFKMMRDVCEKTVAMDLTKISSSPATLEMDYVSLDAVLESLNTSPKLKAILSGYCMCHGVQPREISFANHARVALALFESVARVKDGGDAFITAFKKRFAKHDIDIRTNCQITEISAVDNRMAKSFILNTGEEISCNQCIFTVHPHEIIKVLPRDKVSKAFLSRVEAFEPSASFFSVYGYVDDPQIQSDYKPSIMSLFPQTDINVLLSPDYEGKPALVIMRSIEEIKGQKKQMLNAFEVSFINKVEKWQDSKRGKRPESYLEYKMKRTADIENRVLSVYPEYKKHYKIVDSASVLSIRDYLNAPSGSAYGIKQKIGQFNLFGKLPIRNIYAAGQSAVLPGIVGAMMSSFIVGRALFDKDAYSTFIQTRLEK